MTELKLIALDEEDLAVVSSPSSGRGAAGRRHDLSARAEALRGDRQPLRLGEGGETGRRARIFGGGARRSDFDRVFGAKLRNREAVQRQRASCRCWP